MREKPDLVQRFVDASIEGWYSYLYGDPAPANELIKRDNPEMTDALLAYGIAKIKEYGIVDSGDAKRLGIGTMTEARWQAFFATMAKAGVRYDEWTQPRLRKKTPCDCGTARLPVNPRSAAWAPGSRRRGTRAGRW